MERIQEKIKQALIKDFDELYKKGYTTDWKSQRLVRSTEIDIMEFNHLFQSIEYLLAENKKQREALDKAHVLLDKYESMIGEDVLAENKRLKEALLTIKKDTHTWNDTIDEAIREE